MKRNQDVGLYYNLQHQKDQEVALWLEERTLSHSENDRLCNILEFKQSYRFRFRWSKHVLDFYLLKPPHPPLLVRNLCIITLLSRLRNGVEYPCKSCRELNVSYFICSNSLFPRLLGTRLFYGNQG